MHWINDRKVWLEPDDEIIICFNCGEEIKGKNEVYNHRVVIDDDTYDERPYCLNCAEELFNEH